MLIYCIENTVNGKCYIGKTIQSFHRRISHHKYCLNNNKHNNKLQCDWDKYGETVFRWYILEDNITCVNRLTEKENRWISVLKTYEDRRGYNIAHESYVNEISENSRRKQTGNYEIPVIKYSLDGKRIKRYNSITEASNDVGVAVNTLTVCLQGITKKSGGYQWRYANDNPPNKIPKYVKYKPHSKKVAQYSLDGKLIKTYETVKDATKVLERNITNVMIACRNKGATCAGFQLKYYKDKPLKKIEPTLSHAQKVNKDREKRVVKCDLEGNELEVYDNVRHAAEENDLYYNTIRCVCGGSYYKDDCGGFKWKYKK